MIRKIFQPPKIIEHFVRELLNMGVQLSSAITGSIHTCCAQQLHLDPIVGRGVWRWWPQKHYPPFDVNFPNFCTNRSLGYFVYHELSVRERDQGSDSLQKRLRSLAIVWGDRVQLSQTRWRTTASSGRGAEPQTNTNRWGLDSHSPGYCYILRLGKVISNPKNPGRNVWIVGAKNRADSALLFAHLSRGSMWSVYRMARWPVLEKFGG